MQDAEVRQAFFKEVGQQSDFQAVLEHDFIGANARARRIDEQRVKETPGETGRNAAMRLATAMRFPRSPATLSSLGYRWQMRIICPAHCMPVTPPRMAAPSRVVA